MKRPQTRTHDPLLAHERLIAERYVKPGKQIDEDARAAIDVYRAPAGERPRFRGGNGASIAISEIADVLEHAGLLDNEYDPELEETIVFENNAGLVFRGAAPTKVNGGSTVIGTGGSVTLADATDNSGRIVANTGTGVSTTGTIVTITFAVPKQAATYGILLTAADNTASGTPGQSVYGSRSSRTTTSWVLANTTALSSSTTYEWDYLIVERTSL